MEITTLITSVKTAISGLGSVQTNAVLRERISLIREQIDIIQKSHEVTEQELADAKAKIEVLKEQIASNSVKEEFIQHRSAAFRKDASGSYVRAVYCPNCLIQVGSGFPRFPFQCSKCGWISEFTGRALSQVISSLPK